MKCYYIAVNTICRRPNAKCNKTEFYRAKQHSCIKKTVPTLSTYSWKYKIITVERYNVCAYRKWSYLLKFYITIINLEQSENVERKYHEEIKCGMCIDQKCFTLVNQHLYYCYCTVTHEKVIICTNVDFKKIKRCKANYNRSKHLNRWQHHVLY